MFDVLWELFLSFFGAVGDFFTPLFELATSLMSLLISASASALRLFGFFTTINPIFTVVASVSLAIALIYGILRFIKMIPFL